MDPFLYLMNPAEQKFIDSYWWKKFFFFIEILLQDGLFLTLVKSKNKQKFEKQLNQKRYNTFIRFEIWFSLFGKKGFEVLRTREKKVKHVKFYGFS